MRPSTFDDCIGWARVLFQDHFHNTIAQLLYNFPPDHVSHELFMSSFVSPPFPPSLPPFNSVFFNSSFPLSSLPPSLQFFFSEADIGKNCAEVSQPKLAELNSYMKVEAVEGELTEETIRKFKVTCKEERREGGREGEEGGRRGREMRRGGKEGRREGRGGREGGREEGRRGGRRG